MEIKFSKMYPKLSVPGPSTARIAKIKLLQVLKVDIRDLSKHFTDYDTDNNSYKLPDRGQFLLLIFKKETGPQINGADLLTTLRSAKPGKEYFYQQCVGKTFDVTLVKPSSRRVESSTPDMPDLSPDSPGTSN